LRWRRLHRVGVNAERLRSLGKSFCPLLFCFRPLPFCCCLFIAPQQQIAVSVPLAKPRPFSMFLLAYPTAQTQLYFRYPVPAVSIGFSNAVVLLIPQLINLQIAAFQVKQCVIRHLEHLLVEKPLAGGEVGLMEYLLPSPSDKNSMTISGKSPCSCGV